MGRNMGNVSTLISKAQEIRELNLKVRRRSRPPSHVDSTTGLRLYSPVACRYEAKNMPLPPGLSPVEAGRIGLWLLGQRNHTRNHHARVPMGLRAAPPQGPRQRPSID